MVGDSQGLRPNDGISVKPMEDSFEKQIAVDYEHSANLPDILQVLQTSLLISTYQAGKLVVIGSAAGKPTFSFHSFDQVMGIATAADQIAIGARREIHFLNSAHEVASGISPVGQYDGCFLSRSSITTGSIHGHDLAFGVEGLWVVNTLFSCLCTLDRNFNFFPRWRPPFVSQLIGQDRCHLNGLAIDGGKPRYVTVLGLTDEPAGWRGNKRDGGAILDVLSGEIVCSGLCMPHSPRVHGGRLWVLNSGRGELSVVDINAGKLQVVAALPGYTRGLSFHGNYAFVGLSRIRETNIFGGLPIGENPEKLICGLAIVDLSTGQTVSFLRFKSGVEELFAVETIVGLKNPRIVGPSSIAGEEDEIWVVPPLEAQTLAPRYALDAAAQSRPASPHFAGSANPPPTLNSRSHAEQLSQQADAAQLSGNLMMALDLLEQAAATAPNSPLVLNRLGNLYQDLNNKSQAKEYYQRTLLAAPGFAAAHQNLGVLCAADNEPLRALHHFEQAQKLSPETINLALAAKVLPVIYDSAEQLQYWRQRLTNCIDSIVSTGQTIDTTNTIIPTSFHFAYQGGNDRRLMESLGRIYRGVNLCDGFKDVAHRPKGKRLRIGFTSAYFCQHTIGLLNLGLIENLDRDRFEVFVIALKHHADQYSERFRKSADHYLEVSRGPAKARQAIAELGLDILVFADIGMDCLSQTLSYSRMAPIQAVTWGHPDTTGSPAIDYFVSTALAEPADAQDHYSEQLICLNNFGVFYERPELSAPRKSLSDFGLNPNRRVYLCPQTLFKFHPEFDQPLRRILELDPQGDLVMIQGNSPVWLEHLLKRWRRELPDADRRVRCLPSLPRSDFLQLLSIADVMLDPFPFCGGNTSYEALSLGTPIVTCPGNFLRGRLTHGLYRRIGIESLSVQTAEEYASLAVELAMNREWNSELRLSLKREVSVLFQNHEDIESWEEAFSRMVG
jgi:uncharacterized protein (TIGR03032 family)